jgi:hypothetical protein
MVDGRTLNFSAIVISLSASPLFTIYFLPSKFHRLAYRFSHTSQIYLEPRVSYIKIFSPCTCSWISVLQTSPSTIQNSYVANLCLFPSITIFHHTISITLLFPGCSHQYYCISFTLFFPGCSRQFHPFTILYPVSSHVCSPSSFLYQMPPTMESYLVSDM